MKIFEVVGSPQRVVTLYHGTCPENATHLVKSGWNPNFSIVGANMGQSRYLYLTTHKEDALWFSNEKGCNTVVEVRVPVSYLRVDPEDGVADTVEKELNNDKGIPGKVVLFKPLTAEHFTLDQLTESSTTVKVGYHVTPTRNVKYIIKNGLIPQIGSNSSSYGETEERLYFFPSVSDAENSAMTWLGDQYEDEIISLLAVDLTGIPMKKDVEWEFYTNQAIPPERIKVLNTDF
jgi:hypothetical protein